MKHLPIVVLAVFAIALPLSALNNRSAVSVNGLDTNPCTTSSPCRSFATAIGQTNPGGEIIALDSAGYGSMNITTPMMVSGAPGVHAAITVSSGNPITVIAGASDLVTISNLVLMGPNASHGISIDQAGEVRILNCLIVNITGPGIRTIFGRVTVDHCQIMDASEGISLNGSSATVNGVISNSLFYNDTDGVIVSGAGSGEVVNCVIEGSTAAAVSVGAFFGTNTPTRLVVESSSLLYSNIAVQVTQSGTGNTGVVYLAQDDITFDTTAVSVSGAGAGVFSFGNNRIVEVSTVGPFSQTPLQ